MPSATPAEQAYAQRLQQLTIRGGLLRRIFDPQQLYGWHTRRLRPGFLLDVGCGIGRILGHVHGNGVGVDANPACVEAACAQGFSAYTSEELERVRAALLGRFDSLVLSHVLEHVDQSAGDELLRNYLDLLRGDGQIIVICPQRRGQSSDATHVRLVGPTEIEQLASRLGLRVALVRSFPFPRFAGRWFTYNETVAVLR